MQCQLNTLAMSHTLAVWSQPSDAHSPAGPQLLWYWPPPVGPAVPRCHFGQQQAPLEGTRSGPGSCERVCGSADAKEAVRQSINIAREWYVSMTHSRLSSGRPYVNSECWRMHTCLLPLSPQASTKSKTMHGACMCTMVQVLMQLPRDTAVQCSTYRRPHNTA